MTKLTSDDLKYSGGMTGEDQNLPFKASWNMTNEDVLELLKHPEPLGVALSRKPGKRQPLVSIPALVSTLLSLTVRMAPWSTLTIQHCWLSEPLNNNRYEQIWNPPV